MSKAHPRSSLLLICVFFAAASSVTMAATAPMLETSTEDNVCNWNQQNANATRVRTDESCYIFISVGMTFHEANESCVNEGAHLVYIGNKGENALVVKLKQMAEVWIGLYRPTNEICGGSSCTSWMWLDGSDPGYYNWRDGVSDTTTQCVFMNAAGIWEHTQLCTSNLGFVCEKSIPPSTTTPELNSLAVTSKITDASLSNSETGGFSIFIGVGLFVGMIVIAFIVGAVVCVMKRRHGRQMGSSQVTTGRDVLTDMGNYENVDMSVTSHGRVISQTVTPEDAYVNTRNHEHVPTNRPAYEEVSNYTTVSPEYTPLQFTGPH